MNNRLPTIDIYTDGSCHTQHCIGAWTAIILFENDRQVLHDTVTNTTHNQMELLAVIEAIRFVKQQYPNDVQIYVYSDSQYVTGLPSRQKRMEASGFKSKKGTSIQNDILAKLFFETINGINVSFEKVKAHQRKTNAPNYNIEADLLARKMVRETVKNFIG